MTNLIIIHLISLVARFTVRLWSRACKLLPGWFSHSLSQLWQVRSTT